MGFFDKILTSVIPQTASPACVLPIPKVKQRATVSPKESDVFVINKDTETYGFHTATAIKQNTGSVPNLTNYDVSELKSRSLWGNEKKPQGRTTNANNTKAKQQWHEGSNAAQIAKFVGLSESWAEKRHAAFEDALKAEVGE